MTETTLKVTSLGENQMYNNGRAKFAQIYTLINMKKGTDILNPDKGVDINSYYYAYNDPVVLADLERIINDQINRYTPYRPYTVNCGSKFMVDRYILSIMISLQNADDKIIIVSNGEQSDFDVIKAS